jgi:hypothetical protein
MRSFAARLPLGFEIASYPAPAHITAGRRLLSIDRVHMAAAGCLARITVCGRCLEVWGPTPDL